jgi:hypothetical protein
VKRTVTFLAWIIAGLWAVITLAASNSPTDVKARANEWLAIPIIGQVPSKVANFVASPWVLATSFMILGVALGIWIARRKNAVRNLWRVSLSKNMGLLIYQIENLDWRGSEDAIYAKINLIAVQAKKCCLAFPSNVDGQQTFNSLLPYLYDVSAFLSANEIEQARLAAARHSVSFT